MTDRVSELPADLAARMAVAVEERFGAVCEGFDCPSGDDVGLVETAHRLAGLLGAMGVVAATERAKALEVAGRGGRRPIDELEGLRTALVAARLLPSAGRRTHQEVGA